MSVVSQPLNIAVLTISDTRTLENDKSGDYLKEALTSVGHNLYDRDLVKDDIYQQRAVVSKWIADRNIHAVLITGGTGFTHRDSTPEAISVLFDKEVDGFGELFRQISYEEIGTSTIQSRAVAGFANNTVIFCLPGSTGACRTAWEKIISSQLDADFRPCNFVDKDVTKREATAEGFLHVSEDVIRQISEAKIAKGDVFAVARVAGIQGAKRCADLIPLCHPLALSKVDINFDIQADQNRIKATCYCKLSGKTGVEMEALTGVNVALLTLFDMCKAIDPGMHMEGIRVLEKKGGKTGHWQSDT